MAAALIAAACTGSPEKTVLTGTTAQDYSGNVTVTIPDAQIDTTVSVAQGAFSIELPCDNTVLATVKTDASAPVQFVPDGSAITVDFTGEAPVVASSSEKSATTALVAMKDYIKNFNASYRESSDDQRDSLYNVLIEDFKGIVAANADNIVGVSALRNIYYDLELEDLESVLGTFSPKMQENSFIVKAKATVETKKATAEGQPFVDFKVETVVSTDKNGEPVYKTDSLSNYVGKGKVMLVDFWSPWCGPCRAEIPNIKSIYEKFHGDDFDVLSVAVWEESRKMTWKNSVDTAAVYGITWNQLNNGHSEPTTLYGIEGIPHLILFGADGTILKRGLRGEELTAAVAEALGR